MNEIKKWFERVFHPKRYYMRKISRLYFGKAEAWYDRAIDTSNPELKRCAEDFINTSMFIERKIKEL